MFKDKVLLITGGTGSFGNAVVRRFLHTDIGEIRIFSRDEKKQDDMRHELRHSKLKFYIGDVRDFKSISGAMRGVDYVFNAAALKQVPSCEFFPLEAVRTNTLGAENVMNAARECGALCKENGCSPRGARRLRLGTEWSGPYLRRSGAAPVWGRPV